MTTDKNSPGISLGSGSYDYDALKKAGDDAIAKHKGDTAKAEDAIAVAVDKANRSPSKDADPRYTPGYETVKRKGSTGVTETIQVPVPASDDEIDAETEKAAAPKPQPSSPVAAKSAKE